VVQRLTNAPKAEELPFRLFFFWLASCQAMVLNLVGRLNGADELLFRSEAEIGQQADGDDREAEPDGQVIFLCPQIRPAALAVIDNNIGV
jgi:hypothetical protein